MMMMMNGDIGDVVVLCGDPQDFGIGGHLAEQSKC